MTSTEADKYRGMTDGVQGRRWQPATGCRVYMHAEVLPELKGQPWDDAALSLVSILNPSHIRVVAHGTGVQLDSRIGRVTVWMDEQDRIKVIDFVNTCWAPDSIDNGQHLHCILHGLPYAP